MRGVKSNELGGKSNGNFPIWANSDPHVPFLKQEQLQLTPPALKAGARTFIFQIHLVPKTEWV